jgi:AAA family ATPase
MEKTLEVKIRPYSNQNVQDHSHGKGVSRVYVSRDALFDLGLQRGQAIHLWKKDESTSTRREAIVWDTAEKNMSKRVVQMSKTFQELCDFKLSDDLVVGAAWNGKVSAAESVVLRDVTEDPEAAPNLDSEDKPHWEWYLRGILGMFSF